MSTEVKPTYEELKIACEVIMEMGAMAIEYRLSRMSDTELNKIPVLGFTKEQCDFIRTHAICFDQFHSDEYAQFYSFGGEPFKIFITN